MANISERPLDQKIAENIKGSAREALKVLGLTDKSVTASKAVEAVDTFVYRWQRGKRPDVSVIDPDDAPFMMGSLWGHLLVKKFSWEWAMLKFHDHGDSIAPGVLSPDRALAVYPIHFLIGCFRDPSVDCTILLSYNMLKAGSVGEVQPGEYMNLMEGVHRIVPRD